MQDLGLYPMLHAGISSCRKQLCPIPTRLGMLSGGNTAAGRWLRAGAQTTAKMHAKKLREAARLKALQVGLTVLVAHVSHQGSLAFRKCVCVYVCVKIHKARHRGYD